MKDFLRRVGSTRSDRAKLQDTERMIRGDHWLDAKGWIGPMPAQGDENRSVTIDEIKRGFVFRNALADVCDRHRSAVVGREVAWGFTPARAITDDESKTDEENDLIKEAEAALTKFWDHQGAQKELQHAVYTLLWAMIDGKRAVSPLRVFLPASSFDTEGRVPPGDLEESAQRVAVAHVNPRNAGILKNQDGQAIASFYFYKEGEQDRLELVALTETLRDAGLLTDDYPEPNDGDTVVQIYAGDALLAQAAYPLGGHLLMFELERDPLITTAAISQQKLLNLALTMLTRNVHLAGFLEETYFGVKPPGYYRTAEGKVLEEDDGQEGTVFVKEPLNTGAGARNFMMGAPMYDKDGNHTGYSPTNVHTRNPVPVTTFRDTAEIALDAIHQEARQMHARMSGDATASGLSRIQATADFVSSLGTTGAQVELAVRWLLETTLRLAALFANQTERFAGLRAYANVKLSAVQPTPQDAQAAIALQQAGIISRENAMTRVAVEDTEAEFSRLEAEHKTVTDDVRYIIDLREKGLISFEVAVRAVASLFPDWEEADIEAFIRERSELVTPESVLEQLGA